MGSNSPASYLLFPADSFISLGKDNCQSGLLLLLLIVMMMLFVVVGLAFFFFLKILPKFTFYSLALPAEVLVPLRRAEYSE